LIFTSGYSNAIAIQDNGRILLGGSGVLNGESGHLIIRLLDDGSIDSSFGNKGGVALSYAQYGIGEIADLKIQTDGKIMAVSNITNSDIMLIRLKRNGKFDSSFGINGIVTPNFQLSTHMFDMQIQPDGKYVLAGHNYNDYDGNRDIVVLRFNTDGSLDKSFGGSGEVIISLNYAKFATAVILQPDGKIIVGGASNFLTHERFFIVRLNKNGMVDTSFGSDGTITTEVGGGQDHINSMALQPDGKILAAGPANITNQAFKEKIALIRYNNDGSLDESFGINGLATAKFENKGVEAKTVLLQQDARIIVAGTALGDHDYYRDPCLARFKPDGSLDSSFGVNGMKRTRTADGGDIIYDAALQPDGKIVLTGETYIHDSYYTTAFRYNNDIQFNHSTAIGNTLAVMLYPNPVRDVLNIKGLDAGMSYELSVMSVPGNLVAQTSVINSSSYTWNVEGLSKGIYYLRITSNKKTTTVEFLKE